MAIRIVCPQCRASLAAATAPPTGAKMKCPHCQHTFPFAPPPPPPPSAAAGSRTTQPVVTSPSADAEQAEKGSAWPLLIALIGLVLVVSVCGYVMRDTLAGLFGNKPGELAEQSGSNSDDYGDGATADPASTTVDATSAGVHPIDVARARATTTRSGLPKLPFVRKAEEAIFHFAFSSDQVTLACSSGNTVEIWDLTTAKKRKTLDYEPGYDLRLEFSPDGQVLAAISHTDNAWACKLWLLPDAVEIASFEWEETAHEQGYHAPLAFSASSERVAVPGDEHSIIVWDLTAAGELARLEGHQGRIDDLLFTRDGRQLISVSGEYDNPSIRQWSLDGLRSGREVMRDKWAYQAVMTSDEKRLVTRGLDEVSIWNRQPDGLLRLDHQITDYVPTDIALWPNDSTLAMQVQSTLVLWDMSQQKVLREVPLALRGTDEVTGVLHSPDGRTLGAITEEGVTLYDVETGQVRTKYPHVVDGSEYAGAFAFDYTGGILVVAMDTGQLRFESTTAGTAGAPIVSKSLTSLAIDTPVLDVSFGPDSKTLVTQLKSRPINRNDSTLVAALTEFNQKFRIESLKWNSASPEQRMDLETKFYMQNLHSKLAPMADREKWGEVGVIWELNSPPRERRSLRQPMPGEADLRAFGRVNGNVLRLGAERFLDPHDDHLVAERELTQRLAHYPFSCSGDRHVMWLSRSGGFLQVDLTTLQETTVALAPTERLHAWNTAPDGRTLAVIVQQGRGLRLVLINTQEGKETLSMPLGIEHNALVSDHLCFSADGVNFATFVKSPGADSFALRVWDTATGREPNPPLEAAVGVSVPGYLVSSPDGTLLTYHDPQSATQQVVETLTGRKLATTAYPGYLPTFSPDSRSLALVHTDIGVGEAQNKVAIVDLSNGQLRHTMTGFTTIIQSLAYSPDSRMLAVAGGGPWNSEPGGERVSEPDPERFGGAPELKLFDANSGELLAVLGGHTSLVTQVCFSPNNRLLASYAWDGSVRIWDLVDSLSSGADPAVKHRSRPPLAKIRRP